MSAQQTQLDEGIRTPPPTYDEVVKSEKLPSYKSVEVEDTVTAQPQPSAPPLDILETPNQQENEQEPKCGDFCEPYYDEQTNHCLVCFFCNVFVWPIAACCRLFEDMMSECYYCCCEPDNPNRNRNITSTNIANNTRSNNTRDEVDYTPVNNREEMGCWDDCCCLSLANCEDWGCWDDNDDNDEQSQYRHDYWADDNRNDREDRTDDDDGLPAGVRNMTLTFSHTSFRNITLTNAGVTEDSGDVSNVNWDDGGDGATTYTYTFSSDRGGGGDCDRDTGGGDYGGDSGGGDCGGDSGGGDCVGDSGGGDCGGDSGGGDCGGGDD